MLICNKSRECTFPMGCPHKEQHDKILGIDGVCYRKGCLFDDDSILASECIEVLKC